MLETIVRLYGCPKPIPDECTSSWLYRISASLDVQSHQVSEVFGYKGSPDLLDIHIPDEYVSRLCEITLIAQEIIIATTLFTGADTPDPEERAHRLLSKDLFSHEPLYRYCPDCFKLDNEPYIRKQWRFLNVRHCSQHMCLLLDSCLECGLRMNLSDKRSRKRLFRVGAIGVCRRCYADLTSQEAIRLSQDSLQELEFETMFFGNFATSSEKPYGAKE